MTDEVENIQSPCVRNCCLNEDDICLGCRRSLSEIIAWGQLAMKSENLYCYMLRKEKRARVTNNKHKRL
jgi:predicted Fe-S protein YdhL (DUF1289 family)